jgi:metallophosphoesterase (TIGR00282 family)
MAQINLLLFGDVVGKIGRKALCQALPGLKARYQTDLTVANAENLAHGRGITDGTLTEMANGGVDAFTSGSHVWENKQGLPMLLDDRWNRRLVRPANLNPLLPGNGFMVLEAKGVPIIILNLQGRLFIQQEASSPFLSFDRFWQETVPQYANPIVIVDLHAEATSEKQAFGHYVDGRATVIYGTHTHVSTTDAKILAKGTAYCTDIGMVGLSDSVIGFDKNSSIKRFLEESEASYELLSNGRAEVNGLAVTLDLDTRQVSEPKLIREFVDI